jgi:uncharacterized damage-inducible protein DinB
MSTEMGIASLPWASEGRTKTAPVPGLVLAAQDVLLQGLELLQMSDQQYAQMIGAPFDASIGQHYRHVLEHFQCLVKGADCGEVNYDARQRDRRIETDKEVAANATRDLVQGLNGWTDTILERHCMAVSSVDYESDLPSNISSNLARELAYCIGHTIHHYAIIRLVCGHIGVIVPARFGYAPSTIKHQSSLAAH